MARSRTRPITDIELSPSELRKLKKGYSIFKMCHKHMHCIKVVNEVREIMKSQDKAKRLLAELKELRKLKCIHVNNKE